ncbi:hypothetical protein EJB05_55053 [Eragrostis curvula]|uniref:Aspartate racemase n=1 Tax=Eragrostis curvula TaxID=38414 RepID=A0A5J9SKZ3_9POAL|nr:hypothetical protein EJB05_55053 [Eragrostis curvula]
MAPATRRGRAAAESQPSSSVPARAPGAIEVQRRRVGGGGWTSRRISIYASRVYFLLIILQIPLFRVPCRAGTCTTPIQVTSSQLVSNEIFPPSVVKAMLYPGAIMSNLTKSMTFPRWSDLFDIYNLTEAKNASAVVDLQRLEILAGSYFCVAGALVGIINPGRMTLFGTLLVIWGLVKEALFGKPVNSDPTQSSYVYPTIMIALVCAFMSVTYNVKKTARSSPSVTVAKPLQSSAKSKLNCYHPHLSAARRGIVSSFQLCLSTRSTGVRNSKSSTAMVQMSLQRSLAMSPRCSLYDSVHRIGGARRRWASCRSQSSCFAYNARLSPIVLNINSAIDPSEPKNQDANSSASRSGPYSRSCHQSGTIGVMGASSTSCLRFLEKFVCWSTSDGEEAPPFVIFNDPLIKKELLSSGNQLTSDTDITLGKLMQKRLVLEQSGASCIVMPCQFLHAWHDKISQNCSVPFLHIGDCVVKELKAANLKPVEYGSNVRVGILATDSTLATNCYLDKLESQGFEVLCPDKASMEHTVLPSVNAFRKGDMEGARNLLRVSLQVLIVRAVNTIILASDDLVGILPDDDPLLKKCIDPLDALVRGAITCARTPRP